jgi:hypothetical protein
MIKSSIKYSTALKQTKLSFLNIFLSYLDKSTIRTMVKQSKHRAVVIIDPNSKKYIKKLLKLLIKAIIIFYWLAINYLYIPRSMENLKNI